MRSRLVLSAMLLCFIVVAFVLGFSSYQGKGFYMTGILIDTVLTMVVTVLGPVVTTLLLQWVRVLFAKHKIVVSESMERSISEAIRAGISFAEEQARKSLISGVRMTGHEKLLAARDYVISDLRRRGITFSDSDQLSMRIESQLQDFRASSGNGGM